MARRPYKGVFHFIAQDIGGNLGIAWTVAAHRELHAEIADFLAKYAEFDRLHPLEG
jgi:hypothetical protein